VSLEPGRYYAVDTCGASTTFDLPADFDGSCDLILSSFGDPGRSFRASLERCTGPLRGASPRDEVPDIHWRRNRIAPPQPSRAAVDADSPFRATPAAGVPRRSYFLHVADTPLDDPQGYTRIDANLVREGRDVRIYQDDQTTDADIAPGLIDQIVALLDERIIPRSREVLGEHSDIDGDGKLAVLLTGWLGHLQGGRTAVNGFVRGSDFHPQMKAPFGNQADVLYLNASLRPGPELVPLLAHEYTHAVACSLRMCQLHTLRPLPGEADWINEGIAHVAERLHEAGWSNLDYRIRAFLNAPERAPLVVDDYYRAALWRDPACRGATYLFLQWCIDGLGPDALRSLVCEPTTGIEKLERLTGVSFAALYRHWTIALHRGGWPSLPLEGRLGGCQLSGSRKVAWGVADDQIELTLRGTATAFVRCAVARECANRSIRIVAAPAARLQVTITAHRQCHDR
jgi:hypothetical protein